MKTHLKLGVRKNFKKKIAVIGVGYVGLPLAINLSKFFKVIAFDRDKKRILDLIKGNDKNKEHSKKELINKNLFFVNDKNNIKDCNVFIITLPTPLNKKKLPDISLVIKATKDLAKIIKKKDLIIYESTFYPGTIDNELIPILEKYSKLKCNIDFFIGYSPERINPGDKINTFSNVTKVISGSNKKSLQQVKKIYQKVVKAGVFAASNIKAAELSKILENTQRFINIALMNEISTLCNKMNINTKEVIDIASTKWNFHKFYPGFVGGHCVAVDPLYLSFKQKKLGISPKFIEAAEKVNSYKHFEITREIKSKFKNFKSKKILILGITFKENCSDLRNSGSIELVKSLNKIKIYPLIHDPYIKNEDLNKIKRLRFKYLSKVIKSDYDCIILSVAHNYYKKLGIAKIKKFSKNKKCLVFDLKSIFKKDNVNYQM